DHTEHIIVKNLLRQKNPTGRIKYATSTANQGDNNENKNTYPTLNLFTFDIAKIVNGQSKHPLNGVTSIVNIAGSESNTYCDMGF
ncbi:15585_t:CDS:2, partial [Dentiscutata erythropus]